MIALYGLISPFSQFVKSALAFKELDYQIVGINLLKRSKAFDELTPAGKIPVLQDSDGTLVTDSTHIVDYLDQKYPNTYTMLSKDLVNRVQILKIAQLSTRVIELTRPYVFEAAGILEASGDKAACYGVRIYNETEKAEIQKELTHRLEIATKMLDGKEYFVEDRFTLADASLVAAIGFMQHNKLDISPMQEWFGKLAQDPKVAKMFPHPDEKPVKEI